MGLVDDGIDDSFVTLRVSASPMSNSTNGDISGSPMSRPSLSPSAPSIGTGFMSRRPTAVISTVAFTVSGRRSGSGTLSTLSSGTSETEQSTLPLQSPGFSNVRSYHLGSATAVVLSIASVSGIEKRPIRSSFEKVSSSYTRPVTGGARSSGSGTATVSVTVSYQHGLHVSAFTDDLSVLP